MNIHFFPRGNGRQERSSEKKLFVFSTVEAALWTKAVICNLMGFLYGQDPKPGEKLVLKPQLFLGRRGATVTAGLLTAQVQRCSTWQECSAVLKDLSHPKCLQHLTRRETFCKLLLALANKRVTGSDCKRGLDYSSQLRSVELPCNCSGVSRRNELTLIYSFFLIIILLFSSCKLAWRQQYNKIGHIISSLVSAPGTGLSPGGSDQVR